MKPSSTLLTKEFKLRNYEQVFVLSPHMDDAVISCGGLMMEASRDSTATVITVTSADPQPTSLEESKVLAEILEECGTMLAEPRIRRKEDRLAVQKAHSHLIQLGFLDGVYRRETATGKLVYPDRVLDFDSPRAQDRNFVDELNKTLLRITQDMGRVLLAAPMGIGGHIDHLACRKAGEYLQSQGLEVIFYEDFPYVIWNAPEKNPPLSQKEKLFHLPFNVERKARLIECYKTQIKMVFGDKKGLRRDLEQRKINGKPCEFYRKL